MFRDFDKKLKKYWYCTVADRITVFLILILLKLGLLDRPILSPYGLVIISWTFLVLIKILTSNLAWKSNNIKFFQLPEEVIGMLSQKHL